MNIQNQINYWLNSAGEDMVTAEVLINNQRLLHGLFWCHLTIEKILKAHVVKHTLEVPPKTHNLVWLLDKTIIQLNDEQEKLIGELMVYQLAGTYAESFPSPP